MVLVTRFAPSPTGSLHIGGARTALFNWAHARHNSGSFLLRIEDTDEARNSEEHLQDILDGLRWLGLVHNGNYVLQSTNKAEQLAIATHLLDNGYAFYCYEDQNIGRDTSIKSTAYRSPWRNKTEPNNLPSHAPVIRFKAPDNTIVTLNDKVLGKMSVHSSEIEDFVIVRSDGNPTFALAVVTDDHNMGITDIIRGSDHVTNTFKQILLYEAMGWHTPIFAHIPLIHDEHGSKLSKRHGALSVLEYKKQGFLPEAIVNYLALLSWNPGNKEILSLTEIAEAFEITKVGKSPPRFDIDKLRAINHHYINHNAGVMELAFPFYAQELSKPLDATEKEVLYKAQAMIKERSFTLQEMVGVSKFLLVQPSIGPEFLQQLDQKVLNAIHDQLSKTYIQGHLSPNELQQLISSVIEACNCKKSVIFQTLRIALTGTLESLPITEVTTILSRQEILSRIACAAEMSQL